MSRFAVVPVQHRPAGRPWGARLVGSTLALPVAIAILSLVGLVAALTGDGWRDVLAWAGLAVPLVATGWAMRARRY